MSKPFSESDAAKTLGCTVPAFRARMVALGYVKTCTRCGGSGRYSYNSLDGDRCYGCSGSGKQRHKATKSLADEMLKRQESGDLNDYFARNQARAAARERIAPLVAEAVALYEPMAAAYEAEYKRVYSQANWDSERGCRRSEFAPILFAAQTMANAVRWGVRGSGMQVENISGWGVSDVERAVQSGRFTGYERAVVELEERIEMLKVIRAEWEAWTGVKRAA